MEPEIARRCLACGASVRGSALFCPECGKPLKASEANVDSASEGPELPSRRKTDGEATPPLMATSSNAAEAEIVAQETAAPGEKRVRAGAHVSSAAEKEDRSRRPRIVAAREAVEGKITPRVEKFRQASNVMLEEASYDPSLRFVLVAVAIFILSLLILLLNHLLG